MSEKDKAVLSDYGGLRAAQNISVACSGEASIKRPIISSYYRYAKAESMVADYHKTSSSIFLLTPNVCINAIRLEWMKERTA